MPAQNPLARLPEDRAVKKGTLGSGISYYIVENPVVKGRADAALVRRGEALSGRAREDLAPFAGFLFRSGISPSGEGYIQARGESTVFSFPSVAVHETAVLDSTLLMLFTLAGRSGSDEAIIISGDVSAQAIKAKMDIFSLMLPRRSVGVRQDTHVWKADPSPHWSFREKTGGNRSAICVSYSAPRLPQNRLYTTQALVSELFAAQFGPFVRRRIDKSFKAAGIPYSDLEFSYRGTAASAGDEIYSLSMATDTAHTVAALERLAVVLGAIDDFGAGVQEFGGIRAAMRPGWLERGKAQIPDAVYLQRCISHFLYGTNLAPEATMVSFAAKRQLADSSWASLFNNYNRAWLGRLENMNLNIVSGKDTLDADELIFAYNLGYLIGSIAGDTLGRHWAGTDSLAREKEDYPRVRLREVRKEAVSGGETWHYSNGIKLVYHNMPEAEGVGYAVIWPGGMESMEDLAPGEGAQIADIFRLMDVSGMGCEDFRDAIAAAGISMDAYLSNKNLVIRGHAPSDGLQLLVGALVDITTRGSLNREAFEAWRKNVEVGEDGLIPQLSSAMMPGYQCLPAPLKSAVRDNTFRKAEDFYADRFARMNEATIVVIGNADEQVLRRLMLRYAGGFKTYGWTTSRRSTRYKIQDLHVTQQRPGENSLHALYYAETPASGGNYFAAMVMQQWLQRALPQALASHGLSVDVSTGILMWPEETLLLEIHLAPMGVESLPGGVEVAGPGEWAALLDRALKNLERPSASALTLYKERVSKKMGAVMAGPDSMVDMVLLRLAHGKNFVANWSDNVSSVDAARLNTLWTGLKSGGSVKILCQQETSTER